uniref:Uncharacterized protein n=1 Tax=Oryctolagus cuniculus TaxID=9986 RepID=A0A5F9CKE1_RABIT
MVLPRGGSWRAVLARACWPRLWTRPRGVSGGPGCAAGSPAGAYELRGELDRFGGVSVRLAQLGALDRLDAAAFHRGLQGKCTWGEEFPELPSRLACFSNRPCGFYYLIQGTAWKFSYGKVPSH